MKHIKVTRKHCVIKPNIVKYYQSTFKHKRKLLLLELTLVNEGIFKYLCLYFGKYIFICTSSVVFIVCNNLCAESWAAVKSLLHNSSLLSKRDVRPACWRMPGHQGPKLACNIATLSVPWRFNKTPICYIKVY